MGNRVGVFCLSVDVIQPSLRWPLLTVPIDVLIAINLLGHYYLACTVSPGYVDERTPSVGSSFLWARRRTSSPPAEIQDGVRWSESLHITKAQMTRCRKCGVQRPEVCCRLSDPTHKRCS